MANEVDAHNQAALERQLQQFFNHLTGVEQRREMRAPFPAVLIAFVMNELHLSGLTRLALIGSKLPARLCDEDVINLVECLIAANIQLEELHLLHHNITDSGLEEICRLLDKGLFSNSQHQGLSILDLTGNEISGDCIENTLLVSKYDCPLVTLNVSSNPITSQGHLMLAYMCRMNTRLRRLIINSCAFDLGGLNTLLSALANNQTLETLSLDRPLLPNVKEGGVIEHFSKILPTNRSLAHLSLKNHTLYDHHATLLADALFRNDRMISLNLESNRIGVIGAESLASCILKQGARSLQYLGLSFNHVSDDGAIALAEAIKGSATNLRVVTLKNNSIGSVGLHALAVALSTANNLEQLWIFGNDFDNDNGKIFLDLIENRLPYTGLALDIKVYVVDGMYMIAEN